MQTNQTVTLSNGKSAPDVGTEARAELVSRIAMSVRTRPLTIVVGARGFGLRATAGAALAEMSGWSNLFANGAAAHTGYLSGFHELVSESWDWAEAKAPELVALYEQTLKRIWPTRRSSAYRVPRDLTNSSDREERTRFYHHEYQNKLLVGLAEFLLAVAHARQSRTVVVIEDAGDMAPTAIELLNVILRRQQAGDDTFRFILLDRRGNVFMQSAEKIVFPPYDPDEFDRHLDLGRVRKALRRTIYALSGGGLAVGRTLKQCLEQGIVATGHMTASSVVDFYLASLPLAQRQDLALEHIRSGLANDLTAERNMETISSTVTDSENAVQAALAIRRYQEGSGPLAIAHALAIRDKYRRIDALVEASESLMAIGLYDTWFAFFAPLFSDPDLRAYGDGNSRVNGLFLNTAFVLYAMGSGRASIPYLEEFMQRYPTSKFVPTALYAQSMTYGRYQIPVDLDRAESYALRNLALIDSSFRDHYKYKYIKVFAENAYAYIKARQGKSAEALDLCEAGNVELKAAYGESAYRLHRSILIYNTSQVYEIVGNLEHAETKLREAIAADPYYAEYHNDLGNLLSKVPGRQQDALTAYAEALSLSPPYYEAHLNRGTLRLEIGEVEAALEDFKRVLEIKPEEWQAMREIGNVALKTGEFEAALESYRLALSYEERNADLHVNAGLACSELSDVDGAIRHYERAIELAPKNASAHNNLAAELARQNRLAEALAHAVSATTYGTDPDFATNRRMLEVATAAGASAGAGSTTGAGL